MSKIAVRSKDQATSTAIIRLEGIISKLERTIETQNKTNTTNYSRNNNDHKTH